MNDFNELTGRNIIAAKGEKNPGVMYSGNFIVQPRITMLQ
jgi:hypothetical protein